MRYSVDLRTKAVKHRLEQSCSCADTAKVFGVGRSTVQNWVQRYEETGDLSDKPLNRGFKKIDPEKLRAYVKEHPDETQREIADAFHCSNQAVSKAPERLDITRKKNAPLQRAGSGRNRGVSRSIGWHFAGKSRLC